MLPRCALLAALCLALAVPPSLALADAEPLRLGFLSVRTGPLAAGGRQMEEGINVLLKQRNGTLAGLSHLALRGARVPSPGGTALMLAAGAAWGVYSLRGRRAGPPLLSTADNFRRAAPLAAVLWAVAASAGAVHATRAGAALAVASGAVTSGLGYVAWYGALPHLTAARAAVLQLSVPVLAAAGGVLLLGEVLTARLVVAGAAILAGIALATRSPARPSGSRTARAA